MTEDEVLAFVEEALKGNANAVREGLKKGVPPNIHLGGPTLLNLLAHRGRVEVLQIMLAGGAYPNSVGDDGVTALMSAALSGQMGAVNVLLDQGADPNLRDNRGNSALRCAIENCHIAVVNQLCQRGADPSRADGRGVTDAAYAAHAGVPLPRRVGGV